MPAGGSGAMPAGGSGAAPTGGSGAVPAGGPCGDGFWAGPYDPNGGPGSDHQVHYAGEPCLQAGCHAADVRPVVFAGTVYQAETGNPANNAQIGVRDGGTLYFAYSGVSGNFWVLGASPIADWTSVQICVRTANGETPKEATSGRGASCNDAGCHNGDLKILAP